MAQPPIHAELAGGTRGPGRRHRDLGIEVVEHPVALAWDKRLGGDGDLPTAVPARDLGVRQAAPLHVTGDAAPRGHNHVPAPRRVPGTGPCRSPRGGAVIRAFAYNNDASRTTRLHPAIQAVLDIAAAVVSRSRARYGRHGPPGPWAGRSMPSSRRGRIRPISPEYATPADGRGQRSGIGSGRYGPWPRLARRVPPVAREFGIGRSVFSAHRPLPSSSGWTNFLAWSRRPARNEVCMAWSWTE